MWRHRAWGAERGRSVGKESMRAGVFTTFAWRNEAGVQRRVVWSVEGRARVRGHGWERRAEGGCSGRSSA
eukprot:190050-Rhodomonas_salina.3